MKNFLPFLSLCEVWLRRCISPPFFFAVLRFRAFGGPLFSRKENVPVFFPDLGLSLSLSFNRVIGFSLSPSSNCETVSVKMGAFLRLPSFPFLLTVTDGFSFLPVSFLFLFFLHACLEKIKPFLFPRLRRLFFFGGDDLFFFFPPPPLYPPPCSQSHCSPAKRDLFFFFFLLFSRRRALRTVFFFSAFFDGHWRDAADFSSPITRFLKCFPFLLGALS